MDCFRCGSSVPPGHRSCPTCGQRFATASRGIDRNRKPSRLGRRFRLRRVLGEGPIGAVYAAKDEERVFDVAVKMVRPELLTKEPDRDAFVVKMGRVNAIDHPNVAPVLECGVSRERCYVVSPLFVGLPLRKFANLRRGKNERFLIEEVVPIIAQVVDALDAGSVLGPHGDLKPENLILLPDRLVVTDFGLAHALDDHVFARAQRVSPLVRGYRAPELDAGARTSELSDVYSLGVLATELLAGRPVGDEPRSALGEIPSDVREVLARAIEPDPDARVDSPGTFLAELAAVETGHPRVDSTTVRRRLSPETTQRITLDQIVEFSGGDAEAGDEVAPDPTDPDARMDEVERQELPREITEQVSMDMIVEGEPGAAPSGVAGPSVPKRAAPPARAPSPPPRKRPPAVPSPSAAEATHGPASARAPPAAFAPGPGAGPPAPPSSPSPPPVPSPPAVTSAPVRAVGPDAREPSVESKSGPVAGVARASPGIPSGEVRSPESTDRWIVRERVVLFDDSVEKTLHPKEPTAVIPRARAGPSPVPSTQGRKAGFGWLLFAGAVIAGLLLGTGFYWKEHRAAEQREEVQRILRAAEAGETAARTVP